MRTFHSLVSSLLFLFKNTEFIDSFLNSFFSIITIYSLSSERKKVFWPEIDSSSHAKIDESICQRKDQFYWNWHFDMSTIHDSWCGVLALGVKSWSVLFFLQKWHAKKYRNLDHIVLRTLETSNFDPKKKTYKI